MAAPKHVAKKLREMLGNEAGESMVEWLDERDTHYDELRRETRAEFGAVRQEMSGLRQELHVGFAAVDVKLAQLREEMRAGFATMEVKIAQRNAELMKWALGFWIASLLGVVGALAALIRVPR
jgi:hypothetical protein